MVLTNCDSSQLGDDLVARAVRRRIHQVDRWETITEMFGAQRVARTLAANASLADALIEARPLDGYPSVRTALLDLDTALEALLRAAFELEPDTLADVLAWAEHPTAARAVRSHTTEVLDAVATFLAGRVGAGARLAMVMLRRGKGADAMAYALAGAVVHDRDDPDAAAAIRLDVALGDVGLAAEVFNSAGAAATERVIATERAGGSIAGWVHGADALLETWGAAERAWRSPVLPNGFEQRIARAAAAVTVWLDDPAGPDHAEAVNGLLAEAAEHLWSRQASHRVERLEMAARMMRRTTLELGVAGTLSEQLDSYRRDGAWLDRARIIVSQLDAEPTLSALCERLTAAANQARAGEGERLARTCAAAGRDLPDGVLGVEQVVGRVVAPLAADRGVLLVVLDGFSMPIFTDLVKRLRHLGWNEYVDADRVVRQPVVAALPTVTEISRTSLLCGELRSGDQGSEGRYFPHHPALARVSDTDAPPRLFHKVDLRDGGIDSLPHETIDTILDPHTRAVGVVINNIDERLKDVTPSPTGWGLPELAPLGDLLDAARRSGRAVVLTSDHGHVLDRSAEQRPSGGGGERWRTTESGPAGDGELVVSGSRVVTEGKSAVLPWAEQVRYGPRRNGYHGGITLAELAVPLAVLAADDIVGWSISDTTAPDWWHHSPASHEPASAPTPARRQTPARDTPTLFDPEPAPEPAPAPAPSASAAITAIVEHELVREQAMALRLDLDQVAAVLTRLDAAGGTPVHEDRLAAAAGVPQARIGRFVTQLQRLFNLDGYGVIETTNAEVRFDRSLLERQLGR